MSCNYYRGKCLFLNGKEDGCIACPIKKAYNKGVRGTKKDYERPQGKWIPVSVKEPAIGGMYLVTGKNVSSGYIGIDIARRISDDVWTFGGKELKGTEIIAWMPLPEPYTEAEND